MRPRATDAAVIRALIGAGIQPHIDPTVTRLAETIDGGQRHVIDIGPAKSGRRLIPSAARRKARPVVEDFDTFMRGRSRKFVRCWNWRPSEGKTPVGMLAEGINSFRKSIGKAFDYLKNRYGLDAYIVVIQIKMDELNQSYDLHAHMIGNVAGTKGLGTDESRISGYIKKRFAVCETGRKKLKDPRKAAAYIADLVYHHPTIPTWPADALREAWRLGGTNARLVTPGGSFALWRSDNAKNSLERERTMNPSKRRQQAPYSGSKERSGYLVKLTVAGSPRACRVSFKPIPAASPRPIPGQTSTLASASALALARATSPANIVATNQESVCLPPSLLERSEPRARRRPLWWDRAWPYGREGWEPLPIRRRLERLSRSL